MHTNRKSPLKTDLHWDHANFTERFEYVLYKVDEIQNPLQNGLTMSATNEVNFGVINPDELYTLQSFMQRIGVRDSTVRAARRAGLKVHYVHKHGYVYGRDWIDYVRNSKPRHDDHSNSDSI